MPLFQKKPNTNLGIDIGASAIKLVELEKEKERYQLKTYGYLSVVDYMKKTDPGMNLTAPKVLDDQIVEMVKQVIVESGATSPEVRLSVPVYSSFSTLVELPVMPDKELASAIPFEAKKYIPVPIKDVILDWSILEKPENSKKGEKMQVLLVAVLREVAEKLTMIAQSLGKQLRFMESETFSLARALVGNDKSAIVLVDIGARASNISIIDNGFIRSMRNLEIGGNQLTKDIALKMNLTLDKAEVLKKSHERWPELDRVIYSVADNIILEINNLTEFYNKKYNRKIEKCILVGGVMETFDYLNYFSNKINIEVSLGNPFARIIYPPALEPAIRELGMSLAAAAGLAMRE